MFISDIIKEVCRVFFIHERDLMGRYKFDFVVRARFALYKTLRLRGMTLPKIAEITGRHHTSVMNGLDRAEILMKTDPTFRARVEYLSSLSDDNLEV